MIRQTQTIHNDGTVLCGYLLSAFQAYGADRPFLRFFTDDNSNQLSLMDGVATVCSHNNAEELALFLSAQSDIHTVRCTPSLAHSLKNEQDILTVRPVMVATLPLAVDKGVITPSIRDVYPLLNTAFEQLPAFDEWYVDVSHRVRHGCCQIAAITQDGNIVSSAMTVAEWETGGIIGAVATDSAYRRRGYASRCVGTLTATLQSRKKQAFICPKNEAAQCLYEKLGFAVCGEIALLERI